MKVKNFLPFLDIMALSLATLLAVLARANIEKKEVIPVNLVSISKEIGIHKKFNTPLIITIKKRDIFINNKKVSLDTIGDILQKGYEDVLLRIDRDVSYAKVIEVLSVLKRKVSEINLEVTSVK